MLTLDEALAATPIVAILRGVRPEEAAAIADALLAARILVIEVPLNSPSPLDSIAAISRALEGRVVCGAGTVLSEADVDAVVDGGGRIVVSPHTAPPVIRRTLERGAIPLPGVFTPTDAFSACAAGASLLKLFPAQTAGPGHLTQLKAVLDPSVRVFPVGGVTPASMPAWRAAGAAGFGLGSDLYRPGQSPEETFARASAAVAAAG